MLNEKQLPLLNHPTNIHDLYELERLGFFSGTGGRVMLRDEVERGEKLELRWR